tara:strand:- start:84 stop:281 length:198 start_codon:yes stop_codon:yes gene_type:complete
LAKIRPLLENQSKVHLVTEKDEATVAFFLSGNASYITGVCISFVDGYLGTLTKGCRWRRKKEKEK